MYPIVIWRPHRHEWKAPLKRKCPCPWVDVSQHDHNGYAACHYENVWLPLENV
jgi:hypothetical protein